VNVHRTRADVVRTMRCLCEIVDMHVEVDMSLIWTSRRQSSSLQMASNAATVLSNPELSRHIQRFYDDSDSNGKLREACHRFNSGRCICKKPCHSASYTGSRTIHRRRRARVCVRD
jgi:hypothetical protein